ncbi:MAG: hypothetical protein Q9227_006421 [Pyrenula ochraceoflavens]
MSGDGPWQGDEFWHSTLRVQERDFGYTLIGNAAYSFEQNDADARDPEKVFQREVRGYEALRQLQEEGSVPIYLGVIRGTGVGNGDVAGVMVCTWAGERVGEGDERRGLEEVVEDVVRRVERCGVRRGREGWDVRVLPGTRRVIIGFEGEDGPLLVGEES